MSDVFFRDLGLPKADFHLEAGSASHSLQTARIVMRFEEVVESVGPACVVVFGDVNSTLACALVCAKEHIPWSTWKQASGVSIAVCRKKSTGCSSTKSRFRVYLRGSGNGGKAVRELSNRRIAISHT